MIFNSGDRVRLKHNQDGYGKGLSGILKQCGRGGIRSWMIHFDKPQSWAHTGDGTIPNHHGWYVMFENLEADEVPYDPTQVGDTEDDI